MISSMQAYFDALEAGATAVAQDWLSSMPAWQVRARFEDFAPTCPDRIDAPLRRGVNALNMEPMDAASRCKQRLPGHWTGTGASALRWLGSGGSVLVFGRCHCRACPRGKE